MCTDKTFLINNNTNKIKNSPFRFNGDFNNAYNCVKSGSTQAFTCSVNQSSAS